MTPRRVCVLLCLLLFSINNPILAQNDLLQGMKWRMIGPFRAGRTVGATGVPGQPNVFYIGVNNGGVWKTTDYGHTWKPIFDDQPTGSIGALAVAPSQPETIYVGSGEGLQRPDLSTGDGIYKSTDGGKTWRHLGLRNAQQIAARRGKRSFIRTRTQARSHSLSIRRTRRPSMAFCGQHARVHGKTAP